MAGEAISITTLVSEAGWIVQSVMLILLVLSIFSWVFIIQRTLYVKAAKTAALAFENRFWSGIDLGQLYRELNESPQNSGEAALFCAGFREFSRLTQCTQDADAIMDGARRAMRVALSREEEALDTHLPFLATVGSTSPFIGLFGTVIGIMDSFRGLANVAQATLASVAPGIAEALIATAMGLVAAIPAVIAYNRLAARVETLLAHYDTFADEFASVLHRQAHSQTVLQSES